MDRVHPLRMLLSLLCALLVTAQAGAHVHYCLDGIGQPVSVHAADFHPEPAHVGAAHGPALESSHSDVLVFLGSEAPLKKLDGKLDLPDLLGLVAPVLPALAAAPSSLLPVATARVPQARWLALLPPARGPPR